MTVYIRTVTSLADCDTARAIAAAVWGSDAACSTPQMSVHANYGGVVLLAYVDDDPVGFLFSFPALYRGEWVLWSHETAVLPEYLHHGIGSALKLHQRRAAAELGYSTIAWTFDPLISRNAHFNLNKLGASVVEYKVNAYGADENDLVNQGIETDRFIAVWDVNTATVKQVHVVDNGDAADRQVSAETHEHIVISVSTDAEPMIHIRRSPSRLDEIPGSGLTPLSRKGSEQVSGDEVFLTRIPLDLPARRHTRGLWREAFREAALQLFDSGFAPVQFRRVNGYGEYIWVK